MPPSRAPRGIRKVGLFASQQAASNFLAAVTDMRRRRGTLGFGALGHAGINGLINSYGGVPWWSSAAKREVRSYDYQERVYPQDRKYLFQRDPTSAMICEEPARLSMYETPQTNVAALDDFLGDMEALGFVQAYLAAWTAARRDGGSFIYINASAEDDDPTAPLRPSDRIFGFDFIPADRIITDPSAMVPVDGSEPPALAPILGQHGFQSIAFYETDKQRDQNLPRVVHGSRVMNVRWDMEARWWFGQSVLDARFDALWNLRDVEFAQKHGQIQGNPFAVIVDTEGGFESDAANDTKLAEDTREFREGARDMFSSVEGGDLKRVGASDLDDPDKVIRLLASRISHGIEHTPNQLLASSRGSEQLTDQDILQFAFKCHANRMILMKPHFVHLMRVGQFLDLVPRRLSFPRRDVDWPRMWVVSEKSEAEILRTYAEAARWAAQGGREVPPAVRRLLPRNAEPWQQEMLLPKPSDPQKGDADDRAADIEEERVEVEKERTDVQREAAKKKPAPKKE